MSGVMHGVLPHDHDVGLRVKKWVSVNVQPSFVLRGKEDILREPWNSAIPFATQMRFLGDQITMEQMIQESFRVCPHYALIDICAQFIGISPDDLRADEEFCGYRVKPEDSMGILGHFSGFRGVVYKPEAMCRKVWARLNELLKNMQIVEAKPQNLPKTNLEQPTEVELFTLADEIQRYLTSSQAVANQEAIWQNWQKLVFEICCVPKVIDVPADRQLPGVSAPVNSSEPEIKHFRRIASPQEIGYDEVLDRVKAFCDALRDNVLDETGKLFSGFFQAADKCLVAPKRKEYGAHS